MKGKIIPLNFRTQKDSETGHEVIRMTPPHIICHRNYFYPRRRQADFWRRIRGALELLFTGYCRSAGDPAYRRRGG